MKRMKLILAATLMVALTLVGCKSTSLTTGANDVPYIVADHYFIKNNLDSLPHGAITSAEEFYRVFGEATVMGGLPTKINFNKQFAIIVCVPETNVQTSMAPVSLKKDASGLVFTYQVERGEKMSYTTQPMLLIFVDKKYEGNIVTKSIEK